ncbi:hypothetical protein [Sulfuracidifex tepidarius]|uniref:Uncharacterized protein n=1 Tax=Sulfuracidifex tepidarius TaxID=1294262 RepID=A0A510DRJ3_9CREN|nr:hypothetical protein [Sulfuracidifex tepidarius]BBG22798.1 hypothetical protein IC006_0082 [Sulfuracidifex tepidarius]BBG25575.1 hypothetical protein IC007_0080 [Sulfuracidifex tepidarius]
MNVKVLLFLLVLSLGVFTFLTVSYINVTHFSQSSKTWEFKNRVVLIVYPKERGLYNFSFTSIYHGRVVILLKIDHSKSTLNRNVITLSSNSSETVLLHPGKYIVEEYVFINSNSPPSPSSYNVEIYKVGD